jgi:hypothetical protein
VPGMDLIASSFDRTVVGNLAGCPCVMLVPRLDLLQLQPLGTDQDLEAPVVQH